MAWACKPSCLFEMWRDRLLEHLKSRGTAGSAAGMRRVVQTFPQYQWLTWHLMEAESLARLAIVVASSVRLPAFCPPSRCRATAA